MNFEIIKQGFNQTYRVEFQHINKATKNGGKRLAGFTGLRGLTVCVVQRGEIVSIAVVFCGELDQFKKEEGRTRALRMAMARCKPFREDIEQVLLAYENREQRPAKPKTERSQAAPPGDWAPFVDRRVQRLDETMPDTGEPF